MAAGGGKGGGGVVGQDLKLLVEDRGVKICQRAGSFRIAL
jgi:hypothetical protein